jgi:hypothetical protein
MNTTLIDEILRQKDGVIVLVLRQNAPWSDPEVLKLFQDKINGYISSIESGALVEKFPEFKDAKFKIRLVTQEEPDLEIRGKIDRLNNTLNNLGISFEVMQIKVLK